MAGLLQYATAALRGPCHNVTEDALVEPVELSGGLFLAGAFDGISSNPGGDRASSAAADAVRDHAAGTIASSGNVREAMLALASLAHGAVLRLQEETGGRMGTTMTLCLVDAKNGALHVAHVGDSVLLRVRNGSAARLTPEDVDGLGRLTCWLGQPHPLEEDGIYFWCGLEDGDRLVLGTDGFIRNQTVGDVLPILDSGDHLPNVAQRLAGTGRAASTDDISVIVMDYHREDGPAGTDLPPQEDTINDNTNKKENSPAMKKDTKSGGFALLLVMLLLLAGFLHLYRVQQERFPGPDTAATLGPGTPVQVLASHFNRPVRIEDDHEAAFIARHILSRMPARRPLTGLSVLTVRSKGADFSLPLDSAGRAAIAGFPYLGTRMEAYDEEHGVHDAALWETFPSGMPAASTLTGGKTLRVRIRVLEKGHLPLVRKRFADTVLIRVRQHWMEYDGAADGLQRDGAPHDSVYRFVKAPGGAVTLSLPARDSAGNRLYYSVLPVDGRGYHSFGSEKGTYRHGRRMTFTRREAYLMPLGKDVVRDIREKGDILVRTPEQYRAAFFGLFLLWALAWVSAFLSIRARDSRLGRHSDHRLVVAAAGITGLGILTLLGIPASPLQDSMKAAGQLFKGVIPGAAALVAASRVNWTAVLERGRRAYRNDAWQGVLLAAFAGFLAIAQFLFGHGPGGAKVNLLFFQAQPIIKIAVAIYLGIYLANRADIIPAFASRGNRHDRLRHASLVVKMVTLLVALLSAQVLLLNDMGPGVVLVLTAAICYSICRGDAGPALVGILSFLLFAWVWKTFFGDRYTLAVPLVWTTAWVFACQKVKGQVYESAIPIVLVIAALIYGGGWLDAIGLHDAGGRLADRVAAWHNAFDSRTSSDQLAMAIYGYAEGGLTGRAGKSLAYLIPEAHTDLIWASFVSQWGLAGAAVCITLFFLLLQAGTETAVRNTRPFGFFLGASTVCCLGVQSLFILGACVLMWPLSGVPLFGMSFGSTSVVMDLAAVGLLVALSRGNGTEDTAWKGHAKARSGLMIWHMVAAAGFIAVFAATMVYSRIRQDKNLVRPTVNQTADKGSTIKYSPSIERFVRDSLRAGDVLDRKGEVLATDGPKRVRQYPKGDGAFFWTGNQNTGALRDRTARWAAGALADYRWDAKLRGFDLRSRPLIHVTTTLKPPFLPQAAVYRTDTLYTRDYSGALPYWHSPGKTREWNESPGEHAVWLTLDYHLQDAAARAAAAFFGEKSALTSRSRFSVVIVDAATGEVLASSCYPFPDQARLRAMSEAHVNVYRDGVRGFRAFPDMDLACCYASTPGSVIKLFTTVAGFRKIGADMADHVEWVPSGERIYSHEPFGRITLKDALWKSSNLYFIRALNKLDLYGDVADVFWACGVSFDGRQPYCLYGNVQTADRAAFSTAFATAGEEGRARFRDYRDAGEVRRLNDMQWTMAWGGGSVAATPLAVARLVGAIANEGVLVRSRFSQDDPVTKERLLSAADAKSVLDSMKPLAGYGDGIKYKTGTAERADALSPSRKSNDAWVAFTVKGSLNPETGHPLAVVVRFERVGSATSSLAVDFVNSKLLGVLQKEGYLSRL